jgi:3-methyladenine DNA glycosylase AlkD
VKKRVQALASEVRRWCADHAEPDKADKWARYFKEGYKSWGFLDARHPFFEQKEPQWFEANRALGLDGFLALGAVLFDSGMYEEGSLSIRFVKRYRDELNASHLPAIEKWFAAGIGNWAHTDVLCGELLGPRISQGAIPWRDLAGWRASPHKYQRRAVPVALLALLKGGGDLKPLVDFLRPMMLDAERVVQQGLGWFLREVWKTNPKLAEAFLLEYKDTAPRLIFQYATEKMTPAAKKRFRRDSNAARLARKANRRQ